MTSLRISVVATIVAVPLGAQLRPANPPKFPQTSSAKYATTYTIDQFMSPASPLEVSAAKKADKIAWVSYEKGLRNVYVASGPDFKPVRITKFMDDDGVDVSSVRLSDDGTMATFIRGSGQNRVGWVANPSHDPDGGERAVWAAHTDGSGAWICQEVDSSDAPMWKLTGSLLAMHASHSRFQCGSAIDGRPVASHPGTEPMRWTSWPAACNRG